MLVESTTRFLAGCGRGLPTASAWLSRDQKDGNLTRSAARPLSKGSRLELVTSLQLPSHKSCFVSCRIRGETVLLLLKIHDEILDHFALFHVKFLPSFNLLTISASLKATSFWRQRLLVHHLPTPFPVLDYACMSIIYQGLQILARKAMRDSHSGENQSEAQHQEWRITRVE